MTSDGPRRSGMLRRPSSVIERICFSMRRSRSAPGQRVDDGEARSRAAPAAGRRRGSGPRSRPRPTSQTWPSTAIGRLPPRRAGDGDAERRREARPSSPPMTHSAAASASTKPSTLPLLKPSVFRIASSGMRSRTLCAIVLPTTSSSVKNTANRIQRTIRPMSPICLKKPMLKSFSVWVLVSSGEFSNIAVDRLRDLGRAWSGSASLIV